MDAPDSSKTKAAQLKDEGNKCFVARDFPSAYIKYSKAIDLDNTNAVLYANRGQCSISMRKYLDAAADCQKATELDPMYAKAWIRLGFAHDHLAAYGKSIEAYEKALSVMPVENLTPVDTRLKEQAQTGLKTVKRKLAPENVEARHLVVKSAPGKMPWHRAERLVNERVAKYGQTVECAMSSAWTMGDAYAQWKKGMESMKEMRTLHTPQGDGLQARIGALDDLSNAVLQDDRVFHIEDEKFIEIYNKQVTAECQQFNAWVEGGPQHICSEALKMQREKGWDTVRPAISTTVRAFIMRGFMETGLRNRPDVGVEFIGKALEIIEWGRQVWRTVQQEDRGVLFAETFLRGVQNMHIEVFMKAYQQNPGLDAKYSLEELLQHAQDMIKDIEKQEAPQSEVNPGFLLGYFVYPKARAHAMVGFYHAQMAKLSKSRDAEDVLPHLQQAVAAYTEAGQTYPQDDENHAWFLRCALNIMYICGTPVKYILATMEDIRESIPEMKKLWENSALAMEGRDRAFEQTRQEEERLRARLRAGDITLDTMIVDGPP